MANKTFPVYDHPTYASRQSEGLGLLTGNAAVSKFATFADMYFFGVTVVMDTIGTSTYGGTTSAQQVTVFAVTNTSTTSTVALVTATFGPVTAGGSGTVSQAGASNVLVFNTATGVAGFGGYFMPKYSNLWAQLGTDATAKVVVTLDYQIAPLAPVVA